MLNTALAKAVIDTGKKKKTIARLAGLTQDEFSRILHNRRPASARQRARLATVLQKPESELFDAPADEAISA